MAHFSTNCLKALFVAACSCCGACTPVVLKDSVCTEAAIVRCAGPFLVPRAEESRLVDGATDALELANDQRFASLIEEASSLIDASDSTRFKKEREFWRQDGPFWPKNERSVAPAVQAIANTGFQVTSASPIKSLLDGATIAWEGSAAGPIIISRTHTQTRAKWANTFIHELSHRAGFRHDGNRRAGNECSVPYVAGWIAENISLEKQMLEPRAAECKLLAGLFVGTRSAHP